MMLESKIPAKELDNEDYSVALSFIADGLFPNGKAPQPMSVTTEISHD
jgi:hypothetical protein